MSRRGSMKVVLVIAAGISMSLSAPSTSAGKAFTVPKTKPGKGKWEVYAAPVVISGRTARGLKPGNGSPEAAAVHFFASKVRGDLAWKKALPPKWEETLKGRRGRKLKRKLAKMASWKYLEVKLLKRMASGPGTYYIKVWTRIEINGKIESGRDDADVTLIDGKWYVTSPPT